MATKSTPTAKNLETLGAARLAELLAEISAGSATLKRRLRMELAGEESPGKLAHEIKKRLTTLGRSTASVDWHGIKDLAADLDTQRRLICEKVAPASPQEAFELMWRFLELAESVFARADDGSGTVIGIFQQACLDLGPLAQSAQLAPQALAEQIVHGILNNGYGQYDDLIPTLRTALGPDGLRHLRTLLTQVAAEPPAEIDPKDRRIIGYSLLNGPTYEDAFAERHRRDAIRYALKAVADAMGDVDAYIAQHGDERRVPAVAAEIAIRLLKAGRPEEALAAIDAVEERPGGCIPVEWELTRMAALEALNRRDDAQAFRLDRFHRSLNADHLRAYLKRLPDFDDIEAEDAAMRHALDFHDVHKGLAFLVEWPRLDAAADLILSRQTQIDGDHYEILTPAAAKLEAKYPLAATVILRKMIDFALDQGRSARYRHAARHLADCASLSKRIDDFGSLPDHGAYVASLKSTHGLKSGFWSVAE